MKSNILYIQRINWNEVIYKFHVKITKTIQTINLLRAINVHVQLSFQVSPYDTVGSHFHFSVYYNRLTKMNFYLIGISNSVSRLESCIFLPFLVSSSIVYPISRLAQAILFWSGPVTPAYCFKWLIYSSFFARFHDCILSEWIMQETMGRPNSSSICNLSYNVHRFGLTTVRIPRILSFQEMD